MWIILTLWMVMWPSLDVLLRSILYDRKLSTCSHPMPDERFPWDRCVFGGCWWCDAMQHWIGTEKRSSSRQGPYRSERICNR